MIREEHGGINFVVSDCLELACLEQWLNEYLASLPSKISL